jgi:hypothetical protein
MEAKLNKELTYLDTKKQANMAIQENINDYQKEWHQLGEKKD